MKNVSSIAERRGCAIILIGHLNKAAGLSSKYRGLGSIDFRAASRSVLLVGRLKREPNARVIVHDKSSLAPEGRSLAFSLGDEKGFRWLDGYSDMTAEELLCGVSQETKTAAAEELILTMLDGGAEIPCDEIFRLAQQKNISRRTVNEAKIISSASNYGRSAKAGRGRYENEYQDCNIASSSHCILENDSERKVAVSVLCIVAFFFSAARERTERAVCALRSKGGSVPAK